MRPANVTVYASGDPLLNRWRPWELCDEQGRLTCFTEIDNLTHWTERRCFHALRHVNPTHRGFILGHLMQHARPDDLFRWVSPLQIVDDWPDAETTLGKRWEFWSLIVRRIKRLYFDPYGLKPAAWPKSLGCASPSRWGPREEGLRDGLAQALVELWILPSVGNLRAVWLALDEGADLLAALHEGHRKVPDFSVFELVEVMSALDVAGAETVPGLGAVTMGSLPLFRDHLAERLLDLALGSLLAVH